MKKVASRHSSIIYYYLLLFHWGQGGTVEQAGVILETLMSYLGGWLGEYLCKKRHNIKGHKEFIFFYCL